MAMALCLACLPARPGAQTKSPADAAQWEHIKPLFKLVERAAAGELTPSTPVAWQCHFFKAERGVVFVPFTITFAPGTFSAFPLAMYVRVVTRGAPAPAPGPRDALAQYPFEDAAIVERPKDGRISRGFAAPPGHYDLYVALSDRPDPSVPHPRRVVIKQPIDVPDFGSGLALSSIVVLDEVQIDPRNRRLNFEEQLDEPYSMWGSKLTPALRNTFGRGEPLSVMFLVYNAAPAGGGTPDVEVQYNFYRTGPAAESFFTRTRPELLNGHTLGPHFDLAAGDLVIAGQQVPLTRFPDGEYRLEITVTDKTTGRSLTERVNFTVAGR